MIDKLEKFVDLKLEEHKDKLTHKVEIGDEVDMITIIGYMGAMIDVKDEIERLKEGSQFHDIVDKHIETYETMLERNENDCSDKELISSILEELQELKDEMESV